jgi:hypothetical protein
MVLLQGSSKKLQQPADVARARRSKGGERDRDEQLSPR